MAMPEYSAPDSAVLALARNVRLLILDVDGVLTDGKLFFDSNGGEMKGFHVADGFGIKAVQASGIELAIISGRSSTMVANRAEALGIKHLYMGSDDKLSAFREILNNTGISAEQTCFVGDDWIDLPLLSRVGFAVSVPNADEEVRSRVHWVTQLGGGEGAVRELCNLLLRTQGTYAEMLDRYLA